MSRTKRQSDRGESLVEVVVTVVIVSIAVTALLASLATASAGSSSNRRLELNDVVMHDYAEAFKTATASCTDPGSYGVVFAPPSGYSVSYVADTGTAGVCPAVTTVQQLTLTVTDPIGGTRHMDIAVRTP
jgi:type II secretory pathway pseudopilin PulG